MQRAQRQPSSTFRIHDCYFLCELKTRTGYTFTVSITRDLALGFPSMRSLLSAFYSNLRSRIMTWATANPDEKFETTHLTEMGIEKIGSSRWFFHLHRYEKADEMSNIWPPIGSLDRAGMTEFAIASAALLGAEFEHTVENGWFITNHRLAVGDGFLDQGEAATAYLAWRGWWVCYNKQAGQWELARV